VIERDWMVRKLAVFAPLAAAVIGTSLTHAGEAWAQGPEAGAPAAGPSGAPATAADAKSPPASADAAPAAAPADASGSASATTDASVSSGSGLFESSQTSADSGSSEDAGGGGGLPFDFNGYVRADAFVGKTVGQQSAEMKAAYGELSLKIQTKKLKYGDAFAEARLRYGLQQGSRIQLVDLREAYVNMYAGPFDLRLGQQVIVWGRADAINPTNNLTPSDLRVHSPNEDDRRIGNFAARASLNFEPIRIEGVWVPLYSPSELPFTLPAGAALVQPRFPDFNIKNGTEAARVHLELPAFEASVSYLYGYAPLPGFEYAGNFETGANYHVDVRRVAYNQQVIGADFATTIADWLGVRGEAALRQPFHYKTRNYAPKPDLMYVLGIDHTFDTVSVIAQYVGKYTFEWEKPPPPGLYGIDYLATAGSLDPDIPKDQQTVSDSVYSAIYPHNQQIYGQEKQVQHMASLRVEWLALHQTLSMSALGLVNFSTGEWVAFPKVGYHITDALVATVGAELYEGPHDTLFGSISGMLSAGYAELKFSY
jgi:hypothetical protein